MKQESRKVKRFAVQLPCVVGSPDGELEGTVLNVSSQGCALTADRLLEKGTYVSLDIDLLNGESSVHIDLAGVRWISGHRCGLEFMRASPDMLTKLKAFVLLLEQTP